MGGESGTEQNKWVSSKGLTNTKMGINYKIKNWQKMTFIAKLIMQPLCEERTFTGMLTHCILNTSRNTSLSKTDRSDAEL